MSFGLIGGSSFGRPNIGWNNSSSFNKSDRRAVNNNGRSGGRMGGKNIHQLPGSPGYMGGAPKSNQTDRVNYGPRDASMSASGKFNKRTKADRLHTFTNEETNMKPTKNFKGKGRGKYSSYGGGGRDTNSNSNFSFDKSINNGISGLALPTSQNPMGGGAHLQSLELPPSKYDNSKLFVKNIALKPTGINLPKSDIFNFFSTRIFPSYITMLQERVNYKVTVAPAEFQQWFYNIQEALNLWFYVNSVLSYYDANPAGNEGMSSLRSNINSESLNLYDQLGKILETKVIDPSMLNLIRYIHDVYQASNTNPQSALIKFSYLNVVGDDSLELQKLLNSAIDALSSNTDQLRLNSLMKKAKPEWQIKLTPYNGTAKYDENFMTFWSNIPEIYNYIDDGTQKTYMKPYIKTTSSNYEDDAQFGIYGNDYSAILSGLTCFNVSDDGQVTQTLDFDTVHTGFVQPLLFDKAGSSNLRWDTLSATFVAAGEGGSFNEQVEAIMTNPSNVVMRMEEGTASENWPYTSLKPQCQEPITMNVDSTRQDFNYAMSALFNWTNL